MHPAYPQTRAGVFPYLCRQLLALDVLFLAVEDGQDVVPELVEGLLKFVSEGCTVMCMEA